VPRVTGRTRADSRVLELEFGHVPPVGKPACLGLGSYRPPTPPRTRKLPRRHSRRNAATTETPDFKMGLRAFRISEPRKQADVLAKCIHNCRFVWHLSGQHEIFH